MGTSTQFIGQTISHYRVIEKLGGGGMGVVYKAKRDLSPTEVNEISRARGLGICWQPGNVYRIGRTASAKSCLIQIDTRGKELTRYGSW